MPDPQHKLLWQRVRAALAARGAVPAGKPTVNEIAAHAQAALGTDLARRFVDQYYQGRNFGAGANTLTDEEAGRLVVELEALCAAGSAPAEQAQAKPRSASPERPERARAAAQETRVQVDDREAVGEGEDDEITARARKRAAELERERNAAEAAARARAEEQRLAAEELSRREGEKRRAAELHRQAEEARQRAQEAKNATAATQAQALSERADALIKELDFRGAIPLLEQVIQLRPLDARSWHDLGYAHGELGDHKRAEGCYLEAVRLDGKRIVSWNNLGYHQWQSGRLDAAELTLQKGLVLDASYASIWGNLGGLYRDRKDFAKAVEALQQAVRFAPTHAGHWSWLAWSLSAAGDAAGAIRAYRRQIELSPNDAAAAWSNLGQEYMGLEDWTQAAAAFGKAIELDPASKYAPDGLRRAREKLGVAAGAPSKEKAGAKADASGGDGEIFVVAIISGLFLGAALFLADSGASLYPAGFFKSHKDAAMITFWLFLFAISLTLFINREYVDASRRTWGFYFRRLAVFFVICMLIDPIGVRVSRAMEINPSGWGFWIRFACLAGMSWLISWYQLRPRPAG